MMSPNRGDYASASEWLEALKQDYLWLRQLQKLHDSDVLDNCRLSYTKCRYQQYGL